MSKTEPITVYISNLSEDVWPFIAAFSDHTQQVYEINENADLSDRDLFAFLDEKELIAFLPKHLDPEFFAYYQMLAGHNHSTVLVPEKHTGEMCQDILNSPQLLEKFKTLIGNRPIRLISYSVTSQFLALCTYFRSHGIDVETPECPQPENVWLINFFGSKTGIRQLYWRQKNTTSPFIMSPGFVSNNANEAAHIAASIYTRTNGVVIKTNKGHSGVGVLIFRSGELPQTHANCFLALQKIFAAESYWLKFPIIIEELTDVDSTIGGGNPNIEMQIDAEGKLHYLYYCGMRVTEKGGFCGVEIHKSVIPENCIEQLLAVGNYIGNQYVEYGYRGYFDIDFLFSKTYGKLIVAESNVRRTGGTHVFHTGKFLFGDNFFTSTYLLSNNLYKINGTGTYTFASLKEKLTPILFAPGKEESLIITAVNTLATNRFGYIIAGKTKAKAIAIEEQMKTLLN